MPPHRPRPGSAGEEGGSSDAPLAPMKTGAWAAACRGARHSGMLQKVQGPEALGHLHGSTGGLPASIQTPGWQKQGRAGRHQASPLCPQDGPVLLLTHLAVNLEPSKWMQTPLLHSLQEEPDPADTPLTVRPPVLSPPRRLLALLIPASVSCRP